MTTTDRAPLLSPSALVDLAGVVTGVVLTPDSPGYAEEAAPFNLTLDSRPAVVVGAADTADVQAAIRFAAQHDLPVAVMVTGHQTSVPVEDAVLITTRRLSDVEVDPVGATATVGAGVLWQQVVDASTAHGLAPLNGSSPLVGVVGYTLGGGLSPMLGRAFGWAADALRSMTVVTADGERHEVSADAPADLDTELFWGLPGAKSNLGVVTSMTFGLFPVSRLHAGGLFFAGADLAAVLPAYAALAAAAPDELTTSMALLRMPPVPFVPEFLRGTFVIHVRVSLLGPAELATELLRPLRAAAPAFLDTVADMPYEDFAGIHADPSSPAPWRERSALLGPLTPEAIDTLLELTGPGADVPVQMLQLRHLGGALARGGATTNAAVRRNAEFTFDAIAIGPPELTRDAMAWTEVLIERLAPVRVPGVNVNFLSADDADPQRVAAAHDPAVLARLRRLKRVVDPHNIFRINHNITPTETDAPMTTTAQSTDLTALIEHHGIVDAVLRYTSGLDLADADLMTSALTEDAVVDLTPATTKLGLEFPVLSPREVVVQALVGAVGPLDTSHSVTNARSTVHGDEATLTCYADAMHFLPGTGPDPRRTEHAEMMNRYTAQLVRQDGTWRIRHLSIDNLWFDGDPQVLVSQV